MLRWTALVIRQVTCLNLFVFAVGLASWDDIPLVADISIRL